MRLIDADALIDDAFELMDREELLEDVPQIIKDYCDAQPTVDAVPVIRCKDCKNWVSEYLFCSFHGDYRNWYADDYCSAAERKEE